MDHIISKEDRSIEIIAFRLHDQEFCVRTKAIREIRGWTPSVPLPGSSAEVAGAINLRGTVIAVVDLAVKLGMPALSPNARSAIVVTEVEGRALGLIVDRVSDILTVPSDLLQPVPAANAGEAAAPYSDGLIAHEGSLLCFLNLGRMFGSSRQAVAA